MTWEEYRDLVLSAKEKFEAVREKADRKFEKIRRSIWNKYKKNSKHNKYATQLEYFYTMCLAVMECVQTKDVAWEEYKTKHKQATERHKRYNPKSMAFRL